MTDIELKQEIESLKKDVEIAQTALNHIEVAIFRVTKLKSSIEKYKFTSQQLDAFKIIDSHIAPNRTRQLFRKNGIGTEEEWDEATNGDERRALAVKGVTYDTLMKGIESVKKTIEDNKKSGD